MSNAELRLEGVKLATEIAGDLGSDVVMKVASEIYVWVTCCRLHSCQIRYDGANTTSPNKPPAPMEVDPTAPEFRGRQEWRSRRGQADLTARPRRRHD